MKVQSVSVLYFSTLFSIEAFTCTLPRAFLANKKNEEISSLKFPLKMSEVISPFDDEGSAESPTATYNPTDPVESNEEPLDLTWDNVDKVLEEMRPYLIQDGGNVSIADIDGPVVRLQLEVSFCLRGHFYPMVIF